MSTPQWRYYDSMDLLRDTMNAISTIADRNENGRGKGMSAVASISTDGGLLGDSVGMDGRHYGNQFTQLPNGGRTDAGAKRDMHRTSGAGDGSGGRREEDENERFLLSLLPYLREVPGHRKLAVRHELQKVFIDEQARRRSHGPASARVTRPRVTPQAHPSPVSRRNATGESVGPSRSATTCPLISRATPNPSFSTAKNPNSYYENGNYEAIGPPNVTIGQNGEGFLHASPVNYYSNNNSSRKAPADDDDDDDDDEIVVEAELGENSAKTTNTYYNI